MTRAIDIVVNLWTKEITECYPPELDQFWDLVGILEMTKRGVTVEEELALMDEGGIDKGFARLPRLAHLSGRIFSLKNRLKRLPEFAPRIPIGSKELSG
ncbi:MAG: hypothetical protein HC846_12130 [Blastocatellia bacterium]|nr:hypothetical protein [Blastocatellia bacterium]